MEMEDVCTNSPASVVTNLNDQIYPSSDNDMAPKLAKVSAPPMIQQKRTAQSCFVRAHSLNIGSKTISATKNNDGNITITQDDIDTHHNRGLNGTIRVDSGKKLFISEATRRILERMDATQVKNARQSFAKVKLTRKLSGIHPGQVFQGVEWRAPSSSDVDDNDNCDDDGDDGDGERRGSSGISINPRRFSFDSFMEQGSDDGSYDDSDDDGDESDDKDAEDERGRHCKSMGELDKPAFKLVSRTSSKFEEVQEIANETLQRIFRRNSMEKQQMKDTAATSAAATTTGEEDADETKKVKDVVFSSEEPVTTRVTPRRRRGGMHQSSEPTVVGHAHRTCRRTVESGITLMPKRSQGAWKPLSSNQHDRTSDEEESKGEHDNEKSEDGMGEKAKEKGGVVGIGNLWNKLTSSFTTQEMPPKKQRSASSYFRRGKKKADKCQFLHAVALYNFALIRQREELGENHIDCGTTLNEIGVCWMMLGERYPALTAFEEALYILQKELGDGAMEVAETTTNIWMVLHEERGDMECMLDEGNEEDKEDDD